MKVKQIALIFFFQNLIELNLCTRGCNALLRRLRVCIYDLYIAQCTFFKIILIFIIIFLKLKHIEFAKHDILDNNVCTRTFDTHRKTCPV